MDGNNKINPEARYPMRHRKRGKNYAGIRLWNANYNWGEGGEGGGRRKAFCVMPEIFYQI